MKKVCYFLILFNLIFLLKTDVLAANASINISANPTTVTVGNTVTAKVTVSSSDLGAWEYCISYDANILKLQSSTADANTCVKTGLVGLSNKTETFTFKAIKSGSSNITVKSYAVYAYSDETQMATSVNSKTIKSMTQEELEATYSTNAYLKSLRVGDYALTPEFNKDVFEYNVEVENEIEMVNISASKAEAHANVSGAGDKSLVEGNNKFEIKVTAQKGNVNTYVVNIYRKELDPINVSIKGHDYTLVRRKDALAQFTGYTETTVIIKDTEIPALTSEITGLTIVGVKDSDGNIYYYTYENNELTNLYVEMKTSSLILYPLEIEKDDNFKNYEIKTIDYNDQKIKGYVLSNNSKRAIIYAMNVETGVTGYYLYDESTSTVIGYTSEEKEYYEKKINNLKYVLMGFIALSIILLLIIVFRKPKDRRKKVVSELSEKDYVDNIVEDNTPINDSENTKNEEIFIEDFKKKHKKKKNKKN